MKKLLIIISFLIFLANHLSAQTWSEWFSQKKTQKKYLLQQIAALKVYSGYLSKGYTIAKSGLKTIQGFKQGDLDLHDNYFTSLGIINPKIKHYAKVADIIAMQVSIANYTAKTIKACSNSHQFTHKEIGYLKEVFNNLLTDCTKNLDDLYNLITNGNLQMKEDERLLAIGKIYADMQDKNIFIRSFCNDAKGLSVQRSNEEINIITSKKLNGLK